MYKRTGTNSLQENNPNTKKLSTNIHTCKIVFKKREVLTLPQSFQSTILHTARASIVQIFVENTVKG